MTGFPPVAVSLFPVGISATDETFSPTSVVSPRRLGLGLGRFLMNNGISKCLADGAMTGIIGVR